MPWTKMINKCTGLWLKTRIRRIHSDYGYIFKRHRDTYTKYTPPFSRTHVSSITMRTWLQAYHTACDVLGWIWILTYTGGKYTHRRKIHTQEENTYTGGKRERNAGDCSIGLRKGVREGRAKGAKEQKARGDLNSSAWKACKVREGEKCKITLKSWLICVCQSLVLK
jgi:hypothetical protein